MPAGSRLQAAAPGCRAAGPIEHTRQAPAKPFLDNRNSGTPARIGRTAPGSFRNNGTVAPGYLPSPIPASAILCLRTFGPAVSEPADQKMAVIARRTTPRLIE